MSADETAGAENVTRAPMVGETADVAELAAAVTSLARRTWTAPDGERHPIDFADYLARTLTAAAANLGSVERLLAGRWGSWEADAVRQLVCGTAGWDPRDLVGWRTEPIRIPAALAAASLAEDDTWERAWQAAEEAAEEAVEDAYRLAAAEHRLRHPDDARLVDEVRLELVRGRSQYDPVQTAEERQVHADIDAEDAMLRSTYPAIDQAIDAETAVRDQQQAAEDAYAVALFEEVRREARRRGFLVDVVRDDGAEIEDDEVAQELLEYAAAVVQRPVPPSAPDDAASRNGNQA